MVIGKINKISVSLVLASMGFIPNSAAAQGVNLNKMADKFTPELRQRMSELSPETKKTLSGLMSQHTRRSDQATMRQVMIEILMDYQKLVSAIATVNRESAVEAANAIADHRLPTGGMLAYMPLDKINDAGLKALPSFGGMVEGGVHKIAGYAEKGDWVRASSALAEVTTGCVSCHEYFRGTPGVSDRLKK